MCFEELAESCVNLSGWFPFYYDLKTVLVLSMICPFGSENLFSHVAMHLYRRIISPLYQWKEVVIDQAIDQIKTECLNPSNACSNVILITKQGLILAKNYSKYAYEAPEKIKKKANSAW